MFPSQPLSVLQFVQYGKGGSAPSVDMANQYTYLTAKLGHLLRVPREKLPDLNKNDFQIYKGGGLDGMQDSSWSNALDDTTGKVIFNDQNDFGISGNNLQTVVYNYGFKRYVATNRRAYLGPRDGADCAKSRWEILTAKYPWGPWNLILSYGIWGQGDWNMMTANKFTSPNGKRMLYNFCGGYQGDLRNYGVQYTPLYLSTGIIDKYEAESATLNGTSTAATYPGFSGSGYLTRLTNIGDRAAFNLNNINGTGWHIVRIRYTSPVVNGNMLSIYVNGRKVKRITFSLNNSDKGASHYWTNRSDIYYLNQGSNTFEIKLDSGDVGTGLLIDNLAVSREESYNEGKNLTLKATTTASTGNPSGATDGCLFNPASEWSATGTVGEWIRLDWTTSQTIKKIRLYDKVSKTDQVTSGSLSFSDGTSITVDKLQNDGQAGTIVTFSPKTITWVKFTVASVRKGTASAGLGEFEVIENADD